MTGAEGGMTEIILKEIEELRTKLADLELVCHQLKRSQAPEVGEKRTSQPTRPVSEGGEVDTNENAKLQKEIAQLKKDSSKHEVVMRYEPSQCHLLSS